jgi:hypothetical protein
VTLRVVLAVVVAAIASLVAALILGEYEFTGAMPVGAGVLFGLVLSELVIEIAHVRHPVLAVITAALGGAGLARAGYVSAGEGLRPFPTGAWVAIALVVVVILFRVGGWRRPAGDDVTATE